MKKKRMVIIPVILCVAAALCIGIVIYRNSPNRENAGTYFGTNQAGRLYILTLLEDGTFTLADPASSQLAPDDSTGTDTYQWSDQTLKLDFGNTACCLYFQKDGAALLFQEADSYGTEELTALGLSFSVPDKARFEKEA